MAAWTSDELSNIGDADELHLASRRRDGTLRDPVTMWVVRHGDNLYVRAVKGPNGPWYRGTQTMHEGHITAGGVAKDVRFEQAGDDPALHAALDTAYRTKYGHYDARFVDPTVTPEARAATLALVPQA